MPQKRTEFTILRKWLTIFLAEKKLNQAWLAEQLGVSQPIVSAWLSGKTTPRKMSVLRIQKLLKENNFTSENTNSHYHAGYSQAIADILKLINQHVTA